MSQLQIDLLGEFYLGELMGLLCLILAATRPKLKRWEAKLLGWCVVWATVQAISDVLNVTPVDSMLKGVGAPLVFAATTVGLARLLGRRPKAIPYFLLGTALSALLQLFVAPTAFQQANAWKWGGGEAVMLIGLITISFWTRLPRAAEIGMVTVFSAVCFLNNARSMAMFPVLACFLLMLSRKASFRGFWRAMSRGFPVVKLLVPGVLCAVAINFLAYLLFSSGALAGVLPQDAYSKFYSQSTSDAGLILAGRSESLISTKAFLDSPWYGHGSWAKDPDGSYVRQYMLLRYQYGMSNEIDSSDLKLIPTHSYLMGALVWAGLLGGIAWLMIANGALLQYFGSISELPLYFHAGITMFLWNLLFSPFGAEARWQTAIFFSALYAWRRVSEVEVET